MIIDYVKSDYTIFIDYVKSNWGLLIIFVGFMLLLMTDIYLERRMVRQLMITSVMIIIYSATCYIENYLAGFDHYTITRAVLSAINYSLIGFIILDVIWILFPYHLRWLCIPAVINMLTVFISIPTEIVFGFSEDNIFFRGPLGFLPYIACAIYLIYLSYCLLFVRQNRKEDRMILIYVLSSSVFCLIYPFGKSGGNSNWFYLTIIVNIVLYYIFLLQQFTKTDPLTKLLNRQSYYADIIKYNVKITSVITLDMNGLKNVNDSEGHTAGDKALKTLAKCFVKGSRCSCSRRRQ